MPKPHELIDPARLIDLTQTLISIPSVTGQEHELSDWLYNHLQSLGLEGLQRLPVEEAGDTIVGWIDGPPDRPAMLLNFHLDTFDTFEGWQTDPFTPHLENGRLYGLGAHDMKGGVACVLGSVEALVESGVELGGRLIIAGTTDEENWSRGAHALVGSGLLDNCAYCLNPEPTALGSLTVGARGRHVFHLTFHGKTVHAAYDGGINAVTDAAKVVHLLSDATAVDLGYNEEFDLSGSLCVIGLHGGGTLILVPEVAHVYIDRHILPGQRVEDAAEQIRAIVESANICGHYELTWDERPTPAPPPFAVPSDSRLVQTVHQHLAREQNQEITLDLARSVSDMNHIAVYGDTPTLILGPQGGNTCEANEYVLIDSLPVVARTYVHSILDLLA